MTAGVGGEAEGTGGRIGGWNLQPRQSVECLSRTLASRLVYSYHDSEKGMR